jgi:hypothetical protein
MKICGHKSKKESFLPLEVKALKKNYKYENYTEEELLNYYEQYLLVSEGNKFLTKKNFYTILLAFNV